MLRSPPEHIANKKVTVNVDGVDKEVPYTVRGCRALCLPSFPVHRGKSSPASQQISSPLTRPFLQYTENFVNETIRLLCRSAGLARYNMCAGFRGSTLRPC